VARETTTSEWAVATCDGPSPRELAQRLSGTDEVLLLWHAEIDRVELSVRDRETGAGVRIEILPAAALDAFYHPYAYASNGEESLRVVRGETRDDG
jgi:hypothetical protein